jgi:hypothetical protein
MLIESPIVGGALNVAAEQVVDYSAYDSPPARRAD